MESLGGLVKRGAGPRWPSMPGPGGRVPGNRGPRGPSNLPPNCPLTPVSMRGRGRGPDPLNDAACSVLELFCCN